MRRWAAAIGHMTPHTLRRTFGSVVAVCDVGPRRAMYLMGHTDSTLTLGVYQKVLDVADGALDLLEGGSRRARAGTIPERPLPAPDLTAETRKGR
jgi:integrase